MNTRKTLLLLGSLTTLLLTGCAASWIPTPNDCPRVPSPPTGLMVQPEQPQYQERLKTLLTSLSNALDEQMN